VPTVKYVIVKVLSNPGAGDKTFHVTLSAPPGGIADGYALRRAQGIGTIHNVVPNVGLPKVSVGDASVPEGDTGGAKALKFSITLSEPAAQNMFVVVQVGNGTAEKGVRGDGFDWGGGISKKVRFTAGQVSKIISIPTFPDITPELDETLTVDVAGFLNASKQPFAPGTEPATTGHGHGVGTILSDE
jgi:hypothetical protein